MLEHATGQQLEGSTDVHFDGGVVYLQDLGPFLSRNDSMAGRHRPDGETYFRFPAWRGNGRVVTMRLAPRTTLAPECRGRCKVADHVFDRVGPIVVVEYFRRSGKRRRSGNGSPSESQVRKDQNGSRRQSTGPCRRRRWAGGGTNGEHGDPLSERPRHSVPIGGFLFAFAGIEQGRTGVGVADV